MRVYTFVYTGIGAFVGAALTLAAVALPVQTASAQADPNQMAQKAQVMATIFHLDRSGLHDIDESLAGGSMPAGALGAVRRGRIAAAATEWPAPLGETPRKLVDRMVELEEALRAEDVARAAPLAKEVHEVEHDLSAAVYSWLAGENPAENRRGH